MKAVDILLGGYGAQHLSGGELRGQRQLHQNSVDTGILVQSVDGREYNIGLHIGRKVILKRLDADFGTCPDLISYVNGGGWIRSDQHNGQPRSNSVAGEICYIPLAFSADFRRNSNTIYDLRRRNMHLAACTLIQPGLFLGGQIVRTMLPYKRQGVYGGTDNFDWLVGKATPDHRKFGSWHRQIFANTGK